MADDEEERLEAVHALLEQRLDRLGRDVAAREAGAAGGDHHIDRRIGDPGLHLDLNLLHVVGDDRARSERVPGLLDALGERRARLVVGERARVGHGEHRDAQRDEGFRLVDAGHEVTRLQPRHGRACPGHPRLCCANQSKTWMPAFAGMTISYLISTSPTSLARLLASSTLPSPATSMLRTMSPPWRPGIAQVWNCSVF